MSDSLKLKKKTTLAAWLLALGSADFCPGLNRYVYWLKEPIGFFVLAFAASLLTGIFIGPQGYVLAMVIGTVIVFGVVWPWLSLRGISVSVDFQRRRVTEGESIVALIHVQNRWPIPVRGLAIEKGFPMQDVDGHAAPWLALSGIGPWTETQFEWKMPAPHRGVFPTEPPEVTNGFPFGLWRCVRRVHCPAVLMVWPRMVSMKSFPEIVGDCASIEGRETLRSGQEGDVVDIRMFRVGDTLRQVHWVQTARRGTLMVRERQSKSRREVRVIVDVDPEVHTGEGVNSTLEWAMRIAAGICREFHAHHFHVSCTLGRDVISVPDNISGIRPVLDAMARFDLRTHATPLPPLREMLGNHDGSVLEYVVSTTRRQPTVTTPRRVKARHQDPSWIVVQNDVAANDGLPLEPIRRPVNIDDLVLRPIDLSTTNAPYLPTLSGANHE